MRSDSVHAASLPTLPGDRGPRALREILDDPQRDAILAGVGLDALAALGDGIAEALADGRGRREDGWDWLDLARRPPVLKGISAAGATDEWAARFLRLAEASHYAVGPLFRRRAASYGSKVLFEVPSAGGARSITWRQAAGRIEAIARGLRATLAGPDGAMPRVAFLADNRIETALADLACLTSGIVNVLVPANATEVDVGYMLGHARAEAVLVSDREQLAKVLKNRDALPHLRRVIAMDSHLASGGGVVSLDDVASSAPRVPMEEVERASLAVRIGDLATVMYTSGTTGKPKGIGFSQRNLVFKRFARALALPEIGEDDVFLCYLPLYHTFGRFLEMLGCVFWGAKYVFLENPSIEALVQGMRRHRPTVFISVPKKWMELREAIDAAAPAESADDDELEEAVRRITGGGLRWGLSAAGHLDAEVFRFFQSQGIELLSGFGMTEATGGITMTAPGEYRDDSLGTALPGIELRLEEDGELSIRGPYVMTGYVDPPDGEPSFKEGGWLGTGDLMERDASGHYRLVDRKKEIYKNIKGETIAPQRIETLFRDFDSVGRAFLVGDHRPYNTALLWPNPEARHVDLAGTSHEEVKAHFRSVVASVNAFLAPYERIVDFAVIDRDLDPARGELTPKGTPRRRTVETNFAETIRLLYRRAHLKVGGVDVVFPNWLFQALGLTSQELSIESDRIQLPAGGALRVRRLQDGVTQVGSFVYRHPEEPLPLGVLLTTPRLWLGNDELVEFAALDVRLRQRQGRAGDRIERHGRVAPYAIPAGDGAEIRAALESGEPDLLRLHFAALLLESNDEEAALRAVAYFERILSREEGPLVEPARLVLGRAASSPSIDVRRAAFAVLAPSERDSRFSTVLSRFLGAAGVLLDGETRRRLRERSLSDAKLGAFVAACREAGAAAAAGRGEDRRAASLLRFLAEYGASHPARYRPIRASLVRMMLFGGRESFREEAARAVGDLREGFREWLGTSVHLAVDPETGQEYRWEDVVVFDDAVEPGDRERILGAIRSTAFLREAVFLFSGGVIPRLSDIPPGGVYVRPIGERRGRFVHRITVQTRFQGSYDLAVSVNRSLTPDEIREEVQYLVLCGGQEEGQVPLVEDFGGYWREYDLWSEAYVVGETLDRTIRRFSRKEDDVERLRLLWPYLAWSALAAHFDFWNRTGRRVEIADPSLENVVVPPHDYQAGARILAVSGTRRHVGLVETLRLLHERFARRVEARHPSLEGLVRWNVILSSLLEIVGEDEGLRMLREILHREGESLPDGLEESLSTYVRSVEERGFQPMRLHFAIVRYRRWAALSAEATPNARARTLQEFWDTYRLERLVVPYPETRVRFFRDTVFAEAPDALAAGLEEIVRKLRRRELPGESLVDAIADLRAQMDLSPDDDYFLARLSYPHLRPEDAAGFVHTGAKGHHASEIVVTLEDHEGNPFHVRHALSPKEVGRLHRLFLSARLDVRFRPEHRYLVAISERGLVIGGIYYEIEDEGRSAHLEKIVVSERFRRKGVADGLMREFFSRLRAAGVRTVTTGFFRPEYFYAYGFRIEKRYAGLVKDLEEPPGS